jgi:hypothetical protein
MIPARVAFDNRIPLLLFPSFLTTMFAVQIGRGQVPTGPEVAGRRPLSFAGCATTTHTARAVPPVLVAQRRHHCWLR